MGKPNMYYTKTGKKKRNIKGFIIGLIFTSVTILNSGYVLSMTEESKPVIYLGTVTIMAVFICLIKVKKNSIRVNYYYISFLLLLLFSIITYFINAEFEATFLYINMIFIFILSFCISWIVEEEKFILVYTECLKYITLISLFFYTMVNYLGINFNFPIISTPTATYHNGLVFFQLVGREIRNVGIFWEPGLFASFLLIGIVFEISFRKGKISYTNLMIFFLGLLSTNSTAGFLLLILVFALLISEKVTGYQGFILWIGVISISISFYMFYDQLILLLVESNPKLFLKLINDSSSSTTRINGPLLNLNIFKQNPFFGVGFSNATEEFIRKSFSLNIDSQTSTSTYYLAAMGIPGFIYSLNWIKGTLSLPNKSLLTRATICIIFLVIINKEPHTGLVVTNCIMFFLIKKKDRSAYIKFDEKV